MATQKTPKTSNKLKYGDTRADGFRFGGYENVTLKSGITKKMGRWYSPEVFLKRRERSAESSKRAKLNNPEKYAGHSKNWRLKNPERSQNARLKNKFGMSHFLKTQ